MEAEGRLTLIGARAKKGDYLQLNWREMKMKGVLWNWMMVLVVGKKRKQKKKEKKESDSPKWKGGGVGEIPWQWGASPRGDIEPNLRCPILSKGFRPIPTCVCAFILWQLPWNVQGRWTRVGRRPERPGTPDKNRKGGKNMLRWSRWRFQALQMHKNNS